MEVLAMLKIHDWNSIVHKTDIGVVAALELLDSKVLGQVTLDVAAGTVTYTAIDLAGDTLFFGKFVTTDGKTTLYEVPVVTQNFAKAAAAWDAQNSIKFPLLRDLVFDSWENMVLQLAP